MTDDGASLGAIAWALTDEQMAALNAVSERPLPYRYDVLAWASCLG